jgi:hypothetical protein
VTLLSGGEARGDLIDDAERVVKVWSAKGARVTRLSPVFVELGRLRPVSLEAWVRGRTSAHAGLGPKTSLSVEASAGCLTVAVIGPRTAEFAVDTDETGTGASALARLLDKKDAGPRLPAADADEDQRTKSAGGALTIARCGAERVSLRTLVVELQSLRAALEIVVAESREALGDVREVLPERSFGPVAPRGDPGRPLEPGALAERLSRAERRARLDGAESVVRTGLKASILGSGELSLRLAEGCHRLELLAEVPQVLPRRATDVDAEVRESETGRPLARDRADSPDARLDFCLGEATTVDVQFLGAAGPVTVMASDARWPVPKRVPSHWGPRARGGLSMALRRRGAPSPREEAVFETLGVQGETSVPFEVEPGRCYLAAVSVIRGEVRGLRFAVELGGRMLRDEALDRGDGAAVAFCSEAERSALMRVEARGNSPWWVLLVWPMN